MASSLEARAPLLDYRLVEWAARLPTSFKQRGRSRKRLISDALGAPRAAGAVQPAEDGIHAADPGLATRRAARASRPTRCWARRAATRGIIDPAAVERLIAEHDRGIDHTRGSVVAADARALASGVHRQKSRDAGALGLERVIGGRGVRRGDEPFAELAVGGDPGHRLGARRRRTAAETSPRPVTSSATPPTSVATTGSRAANASRMTCGTPSVSDTWSSTCALAVVVPQAVVDRHVAVQDQAVGHAELGGRAPRARRAGCRRRRPRSRQRGSRATASARGCRRSAVGSSPDRAARR